MPNVILCSFPSHPILFSQTFPVIVDGVTISPVTKAKESEASLVSHCITPASAHSLRPVSLATALYPKLICSLASHRCLPNSSHHHSSRLEHLTTASPPYS